MTTNASGTINGVIGANCCFAPSRITRRRRTWFEKRFADTSNHADNPNAHPVLPA
jgi:hypothetical protein